MPKFFAQLIILCLLLQSCAPSLPKYKKTPNEKISAPEKFPDYGQKEGAEELVTKNWKKFFQDKQLIKLIDSALQNNQDLNILDQEIAIASNQIMARQGQYLPKVGIGAGSEFEKNSDFTSKGFNDEKSGLSDKLHNRQVGINASWEVDIWGKLRGFAKSAYFEYLASVEGKKFAVTQLVAEVSNDYYELMALDNQLNIIDQYITTLEDAQRVVEMQRIAARTTSLAVKRFDAEVAKSKSRRYVIQQQIVTTENHLNKLLGRLPQHVERDSKSFRDITMPEFGTAAPAALLDNRPDLRQASLKLEAAKLAVSSVKKEFYPSLTIDAAAGYKSFNSRHFIGSPEALAYNVVGGVTAPLLNRNAIKADYFSANNQQIEAIYTYEKTFITAFGEVSNQLAAVKNFTESYALKIKQTDALSDSFEISNILFKAARVNYLESLMTRRDYLESQMELVDVKWQQLTAYVNLYRALGGGWRSDETISKE